jgi:deoxyribonuclease-4
VQFGAHVSAAGGLVPALERGQRIGAEIIQLHTQSPRVWRPYDFGEEVFAAYRAAQAAQPVVRATVCHASYLINLATADGALLEKSRASLRSNLQVASAIGAIGLVLHLGSHLGAGAAAVTHQVADELVAAIDEVEQRRGAAVCPILMENAAGAGGTLGRSVAELADVLDAASGDRRLGTCLDTQHLFASGIAFDSAEAADDVVRGLHDALGPDRLQCLHVNDSKVPFGANRDRHENLGEGFIGERALGWLLGHPAVQGLPAVLEVPGAERAGPGAADLATARRIHANGLRRWARASSAGAVRGAPVARPTTRQPQPAPRPVPDGRTGSRRGRAQ